MFNGIPDIFDSSFVKVFVILIGIVYFIYRFQLFFAMRDGFRNWRNRKDKYEADQINFSRLPCELEDIVNENNLSDSLKLTIRLLKIELAGNQYTVYFTITGGSIKIKDIISKDFNLFSFEPDVFFEENSIAQFGFTISNPKKNLIVFEIIFEDRFQAIHSKKYMLSLSDNNLIELK